MIYLALRHLVKSLKMTELQFGTSSIIHNGSIQNLGVMFDKSINKDEHVTSICRADYYHLKKIHYLKALFTLVTVVHAVVTSRIDNCNSLVYEYLI